MSEPSRQQSYTNHGHRPYLTWAASILATAALFTFAGDWLRGEHSGQLGLILLALSAIVLVSTSRIYTTGLQNRIIRLEMRVRLMDLLARDQHSKIGQLTTPQLVGLRFASDQELPALVDRAIAEKLSRDDIKKAIKTWVPDWERT
jgi:Family of unknown function (DUF6526)